jgi:RNA polymerase sigma-70 factor (ECF subfamily)
MELDDSTLFQQSLNGNTDAFGSLVNKYQNVVYGLAFHIVKNFADAQDLAQESFIAAYMEKLRDKSKFASWLRGITINVCKMS